MTASADRPAGWAVIFLGDVVKVSSGIGFPLNEQGRTSGDLPFFKVADVSFAVRYSDGNLAQANHYVSHDVAERLGGVPVDVGATVFAKIGEAVRLNRRATVTVPCLIDNNVMAVKACEPMVDRYVFQFLRTVDFSQTVRSTTVPSLRKGDIESLELPLAPAAEQQRIADKLDTVLARVDACRDRLARVAPLLKRFRQSVLAAATSGRLTADWRAQQAVVPVDLGKGLPASWSVMSVSTYATNHNAARVPISEELRRLRKGEFAYYGASGPIDTIDGYTHDGLFLLIGEDGANLLSRSKPIAFTARGKIWVNNHAHVLGCSDEASLLYLGCVINAMDLAPFVTGSAQPKLTKKNLDQLCVPAPPEAERKEIVRRVELLFGYADRLEARLARAQTAVDRLTPSLLAKAFRGELVPQDPADEPAAELLKRLRAQAEEHKGGAMKGRARGRGTAAA